MISAPFGTAALARHWGKLAKKVSDAIRPNGCRLVYHNHDDEFGLLRQGNAMDVFLEFCGPDVMLQIDIGWAGMAGGEYEIVKQYADRIVSLHLKDFYPRYRGKFTRKNLPVEAFAPIGEGEIRTKEILAYSSRLPQFTGTVIIDQDLYKGEMLDALKISIENIRKMTEEPE